MRRLDGEVEERRMGGWRTEGRVGVGWMGVGERWGRDRERKERPRPRVGGGEKVE